MRLTTRRRLRDRAAYMRLALWPMLITVVVAAWALGLVAKGGG
jgi:hypothetical protein